MHRHSKNPLPAVIAAACFALICLVVAGCNPMSSSDIGDNGLAMSVPQPSQAQRNLLSDEPDAIDTLKNGTIPSTIAPDNPGNGLVIGSPIASGVSAGERTFGDGCSAWLQIAAAGQPDLGQTPSLGSQIRAAYDIPCLYLRLAASDLPKLSSVLAVTHAALATITRKGGTYSLSYQVYETASEKPIGSPITLSGTEQQIIDQLPEAASRIARTVRVANPVTPKSAEATPEDMRFLGQMRWSGGTSSSDLARLAAMAPHVGLAAYLNILIQPIYGPKEEQAAVDALMAEFPHNPAAFGLAGSEYPRALAKYQSSLTHDLFAHPANYLYAAALALYYDSQTGQKDTAAYFGRRAAGNDPSNPDAWLMLGHIYSDQAGEIRQARMISGLTQTQLNEIETPYAYWLGCAERAAQLDPLQRRAWISVSNAAANSDHMHESDAAVRHAMHMAGDPDSAYEWELQLYQPKWTDQEDKLTAAAILAANDQALSPREQIDLAESIDNTNYPVQTRSLLSAAKRRLVTAIKTNVKDAQAHEDLGYYYQSMEIENNAEKEYALAAGLEPKSPVYQEALGGVLYDEGRHTESLVHYLAAYAAAPAYPDLNYEIGLLYKSQGKYAIAIEKMNEELALYPDKPQADDGLGDIYRMTHHIGKAAAAYLASCRIYPWSEIEWTKAADGFDEAGDYNAALSTIAEAQTYFPDPGDLDIASQDCYLKLHQPETTLKICRHDLENTNDLSVTAFSHENMAEAYLQEHKLTQAREEWRKVLAVGNESASNSARGYLRKYGG